jgi:hypothetical protein
MRQLIVLGNVLSEEGTKPSQDTIKNLKRNISELKSFIKAVDEKPNKSRLVEAI